MVIKAVIFMEDVYIRQTSLLAGLRILNSTGLKSQGLSVFLCFSRFYLVPRLVRASCIYLVIWFTSQAQSTVQAGNLFKQCKIHYACFGVFMYNAGFRGPDWLVMCMCGLLPRQSINPISIFMHVLFSCFSVTMIVSSKKLILNDEIGSGQ